MRMSDFDHSAIDELLQSRVRLAIVAYLASAGQADFSLLRDAIKTTDGNASVHLRKLEDAGYVAIEKSFIGRKPRTRARLTGSGRAAFAEYLDAIARLLGAAAPRDLAAPGDKQGD
jgi:DNA-binding MarR family transcriptional regulator